MIDHSINERGIGKTTEKEECERDIEERRKTLPNNKISILRRDRVKLCAVSVLYRRYAIKWHDFFIMRASFFEQLKKF